MQLTNQKILITGGGSGVGLALARTLAGRRNRVMICGRDAENLEAAAKRIGEAETFVCDLAEPADLPKLIEAARQKLTGLTLLINNAAVQFNYDFAASTDIKKTVSDIVYETNVNFSALACLTALALPLLTKNEESAVVNVSSGLALAPKQSAPVYCATKAAVHVFSKSLRYQAEDWSGKNKKRLRIYEAILPLVDTPMTAGRGRGKISPEQASAEIINGISRNKQEIHVGKVKLLIWLNRLVPGAAARIMRGK